MPIQTDLSVSPYFDNFDSTKNYQQVLFKPGVALQVRELNTLQTTFQNQIEKFGDNIFSKGTIVSGCNFTYLSNYPYVKVVNVQNDGQPAAVGAYVGLYATSATSNLKAYILSSNSGFVSQAPDLNTLFVRYINSGNTGAETAFSPSDSLTLTDANNSIFQVNVPTGGTGLGLANTDSVVFMSALTISGNSAVFTAGNTVNDPVSGARAVITEVNATAIANTLLVKVRPFANDMANSSLTTSNNWTFYSGNSVTINLANGTLTATATIASIIGSGATGVPVTDAVGKIITVITSASGNGYFIAPYTTVKTANNSATITSIIADPISALTAQNFKAQITVANNAQSVSANASILDYNTPPTGMGYAFSVSAGTIYQKGYFLDVLPQTVVVRKYANTPDAVSVGFDTSEAIINSNIDQSLLDNATGTFNTQAPGADRLKLTPNLVVLNTAAVAANTLFFPITSFATGSPYLQNQQTQYSVIGDMIATRTAETDGDFVLDPFDAQFKAAAANNTANGAFAQANVFTLIVDPGQAYISGYRVKTYANFYANVRQGTDVSSSNVTINTSYGNYINVKEIGGVFNFTTGDYVTLYDTAKTYYSNTTNYPTGNTLPSGNSIGTARIRSLVPVPNSGTPGSPTYTSKLYMFDVNMTAGFNFADTKSVYYSNTVTAIADVILSNTATLTNVAVVQNAATSTLLFAGGAISTKNTANHSFTAGGVFSTNNGIVITTGTGVITLTTSGSNTFPYTANATLTDADLAKLTLTFQSSNVQSNAAVITTTTQAYTNAGTMSTNTTITGLTSTTTILSGMSVSANVTGIVSGTTVSSIVNSTAVGISTAATATASALFTFSSNIVLANTTASLIPGQYLKITAAAAGDTIRRITNIINSTSFQVDATIAAANATQGAFLFYPQNALVTLASGSASLNSNGAVLTISLGAAINSAATANATIITPVIATNKTVTNKTARRDTTVALCLSNNAANTVGPWSLGHPDIFRLKKVYKAVNTSILANSTVVATANVANTDTLPTTWSDITNEFYVDNRQNPDFYDTGSLYQHNDSDLVLSTGDALLVQFDHFTGTGGALFTKSSYPVDDAQPYAVVTAGSSNTVNTLEIPEMFDPRGNYYDLIDTVDFRPSVANTAVQTAGNTALSTINPTPLSATTKFGSLSSYQFPIDGEHYSSSLNYYMGRADRIVIDKTAVIKVIQGTPATTGMVAPATPDNNLSLNVLVIPPYPSIPLQKDLNYTLITDTKMASVQRMTTNRLTSHIIATPTNANTNISVVQPSGYTMAQIATLENRIASLEYGAQLSQLERSVSNLGIPSSINGAINRFKYGFFSDAFTSNAYSDITNPEYSASWVNNEIVPPKKNMNIEFSFNTANTTTANAVSGKSALLPYNESSLISQGIATTGFKTTPPIAEIIVQRPTSNTGGTVVIANPIAGTLISANCVGVDYYGYYADGNGGTTPTVIEYNSSVCGWMPPPTNYVGTLTSEPSSFTLITASNGYLMNDLPSANEIVNFIPV